MKTKTALAAILALAFISFSPALKSGFTNWDDAGYVTNNPLIKNFSPENIGRVFTSLHKGLYKPLTLFSFAVEYRLAGLNAAVYHGTNLAFHLANCALVYLIASELGCAALSALVLAFLFAVHPMRVESVAWIAERKDMLYSFFFLAAFAAYLRWTKTGAKTLYRLSLGFFALSLVSKPQGLALPLALILADYLAQRKINKETLAEKLPFFALAFAFGAAAYLSVKTEGVYFKRPDFLFLDNCKVAAYGLLAYLRRAVWPVNLSAVYPYPQKISGSLPLAFESAPWLAFLILAAAFYAARKNKKIIFGLAFFLVSVAPGLQFFPLTP